jgi:exosome complex RNA-binding protein Csl4
MEKVIADDIYLPGDKICVANHARAGHGTYVRDGYIYAALSGRAKLEREIVANGGSTSNLRASNEHLSKSLGSNSHLTASIPIVSIKTFKDHSIVLPQIGSLVMVKVLH